MPVAKSELASQAWRECFDVGSKKKKGAAGAFAFFFFFLVVLPFLPLRE